MKRTLLSLLFLGAFISLAAGNDFQPNMIPYYSFKTKLWGVSDSTGKLIIPIKYLSIELPTPGVAVCRLQQIPDQGQGIVEESRDVYRSDGTFVINVRSVPSFTHGFAIVYGPKTCGLIDSIGNIVLPVNYNFISQPEEGFAYCYAGKTCSIVNAKGKVIISSDTLSFSDFYKGRAWVRGKSGRLGSVDADGKIFWHKKQYRYNTIGGNSTMNVPGYTIVRMQESLGNMGLVDYFGNETVPLRYTGFEQNGPLIITDLFGKKGIYSRSGKEILPAEYDRIEWLRANRGDDQRDVEGYTGASKKYLRVQRGLDWGKKEIGIIDTSGKVIIPFGGLWVMSVYDGIFKTGEPQKEPGKYLWGFIDSMGAEIVPLKYTNVTGYRYGVAGVQDSLGYHLVDRKGKRTSAKTYTTVMVADERNPDSLFLVSDGKLYGLINIREELIVPMQYDWISQREDRLVVQYGRSKNQLYGVLSMTGKEMWPVKFSWIGCFRNGYGWAKLDSQLVIVDSIGNVTHPAVECDMRTSGYPQNCYEPYTACKNNGSVTYLNEKGELIPQLAQYEHLRAWSNFIMVRSDNKCGVMDYNYSLLLPVEYSGIINRRSATVFFVQVERGQKGVFVNTNGTKYYEE